MTTHSPSRQKRSSTDDASSTGPKPIWQSAAKGNPRDAFVAFASGRDVTALIAADEALIPYDLWTNRAQAAGLMKIGVYSREEFQTVIQGLNDLEAKWSKAEWKLDPALEDVHINVESYLSETCGEKVGGKLHSGRSRNDQAAADMRMLARDAILGFLEETLKLTITLTKTAHTHIETIMPGYTHHRKAMTTTWGHWCASYAQGFLRDAGRFVDLFNRANVCPLGAAASYGTAWSLDREYIADLLAFDAPQENTLDAVSSRGETEAETAYAAAMLLKRLSSLSEDLILFSTDEFGFITLPADFTTGSSIMPQKRNPDFAEAIKGKAHVAFGYANSLLSINTGNPAGYNKDVQWSKYLFLDCLRETGGAASILAEVIAGIQIREAAMLEAASTGFLNAVDIADYLARDREIPFRATYRLLSEAVGLCRDNAFTKDGLNSALESAEIRPLTTIEFHALSNPKRCLRQRDHVGSPHPRHLKRNLKNIEREAKERKAWMEKTRKRIKQAMERCAMGRV